MPRAWGLRACLDGRDRGRLYVRMLNRDDLRLALTFDDVLLLPAESDVLPKSVETSTRLTRNIHLNIPIVSSAMDTVTEARMAIAMAAVGGLGFVHKNLTIEEQAAEVVKVKKYESAVVGDPITIEPDAPLTARVALMREQRHQRHPGGRSGAGWSASSPTATCASRRTSSSAVEQVMTQGARHRARGRHHRGGQGRSCTSTGSRSCWWSNEAFELSGLITIKDIEKVQTAPERREGSARPAALRRRGRRRRGPRGAGRRRSSRRAWTSSSIDTAHGHSQGRGRRACAGTKANFPDIDAHRRQRRDGRGGRGALQGRRRRGEGRHRPRLDLHDARRRRRRRPADHRGRRLRPRRREVRRARSSPTAA